MQLSQNILHLFEQIITFSFKSQLLSLLIQEIFKTPLISFASILFSEQSPLQSIIILFVFDSDFILFSLNCTLLATLINNDPSDGADIIILSVSSFIFKVTFLQFPVIIFEFEHESICVCNNIIYDSLINIYISLQNRELNFITIYDTRITIIWTYNSFRAYIVFIT